MNKTLIYKHSLDYALKHDERKLYRASYDVNVACKEAIARAVNEHYSNSQLDSKAVVWDVVEQYGFERMLYVLAVTVRHKEWDMRFSSDNKQWAQNIPIFEDEVALAYDQSAYMTVDDCHSGLLNIFMTAARQEYLQSLPCPDSVRAGKGMI